MIEENNKIEVNMKSNFKLSKSFKILYVLSCIIVVITFFWLIQVCFKVYSTDNLLAALFVALFYVDIYIIHIVISLLLLIATIILGIINYKNNIEITIRKKIKIMLIIITLVNLLFALFFPTLNLIVNFKESINESNRVPKYDLNATWLCSKYNSTSTRTYTFNKNGQVSAELDLEPRSNYLLGTYTIENYELEDSLYTNERVGKVKSYTLNITFDEYVQDGISKSYNPVSWYVDVYNGNYMKLTLPGGSYTCTMK
ncbi:MAG: hypothetical protein J6B89_02085 [Bacilli bacterium]|nr:hypothetical protein [Bacilli bacterium]